jgi:hypothetical protein
MLNDCCRATRQPAGPALLGMSAERSCPLPLGVLRRCPVQFELPNALHYSTPSGLVDFDVVGRYLTYEYLPRTEANLALTDIRAQHPGATER